MENKKEYLVETSSLYSKFLSVLNFVLRTLFGFIVNIFIWRDKNLIIVGNKSIPRFKEIKKRELFIHNTKYLFLHLNQASSKLKCIYLCDDKEILKKFKSEFKNVYPRYSLKGIYYSLKSKYWFTDCLVDSITSPWFSYNAKIINLWHGIPLKKINNDEPGYQRDMTKLKNKIRAFILPTENYYVVNSDYEQNCYSSAFVKPKDCIKILGSPRLDVLLHDIPNSDLFMEDDFRNIKNFKEQGKKIFIYMPTWRDSGKDISGWLKSDKLEQFLKENNAILVCKLHPLDKNSLTFNLGNNFYKMDNNSDIYPVLKYSDALITDYSSVYFDYLLLDKPIIYYPIDLEEYENTRGFYQPYNELTAGVKTYNENELINAMKEIINDEDNYKEERKQLRDKMFLYQDGKNCERIVHWIKGLK